MRQYDCPHPEIEVAGGAVLAFLDAFGPYRSRGERIVAQHFSSEEVKTDPGVFYPLRDFLAAMSELAEQFGDTFIRRMGERVYDRAEFPPNLETIEQVLAGMDTAYHMNHRNDGGRIGHYIYERLGSSAAMMVCDNPYPCAFDMGLLSAVAKRFTEGSKVEHRGELCRAKGDDRCTYHVEWS